MMSLSSHIYRQNITAQSFNTPLSMCLKFKKQGLSHVHVEFSVNPVSKTVLVSVNPHFPVKKVYYEKNTI